MKKTTIVTIFLILFTTILFPESSDFKHKQTTAYIKEDYPDRSRQGGDTCMDPTVIPALPYSNTGTTAGYNDDYDESCPYDTPGSPDVVYEYTPTSTETVSITLCYDATDYDTKLYVYEGACPGSLVDCNDDDCQTAGYPYGPFVSELQDVPMNSGTTYYIIVDGYGGSSGNYEIFVESTVPPDHLVVQDFDYWATIGNGETWIIFGPTGDYPTLPADFFGPGSDPFEGQICFEGAPAPTCLGDYDTIVRRTQDAEFFDPLPDNATVPIEIVELSLRSIAPIEVSFSGIPSFFDVFVELNVSFPLPAGSIEIDLLNPMGGTFNSGFPVIPRFTFNEVGGAGSFQTPDDFIIIPFQGTPPPPLWNFPLIGNEFDPLGFLELVAPGGSRWFLEPVFRRQNSAYAHIAADNELIEGGGNGYESTWYFYPEEQEGWWNIWFYDHPFDPYRTKRISAGIFLYPVVYEGYAEIVFNWSTPAWSDLGLARPPLPEDFDGIPEADYIGRSDPIFAGVVPSEGVFVDIPCSTYFEIPEYNPEWISLDIRGSGFYLESYSFINHVCYGRDWWEFREFGDAPEEDLAYPSTGVIGNFPTCTGGPAGFIVHDNFGAWLGPTYDFEIDGNAGTCPVFSPDNYDQDECFLDGDAGLLFPDPFTIAGPLGAEYVTPCGGGSTPLGLICDNASWGIDIDIDIHNTMPNHPPYLEAYLNVLVDWNQDGSWANDPGTQCGGTPVPEHVLIDFMIPPLYIGPLSALLPPDFQIGPNTGYVWTRFSITESPVGQDWHGEGVFEDGETEDYLLFVDSDNEYDFGDAPDPTYPTLLANDGARHLIDPAIFMGTLIDSESDGHPTPNCTGDDVDGFDDEDGVAYGYVIPGHSAWFNITISVAGFLNGWIDFNNDGDWDDTGEQVYNNRSLSAGTTHTTIPIPVTAVVDTLAARFRFTDYSVTIPSYDGLEMNGEVEDHYIRLLPVDYGDAPDPNYNTLLANDGPRHLVISDLYLGPTIDYENNAYQSADADGDDNNGLDDEDGLIIPTLQIGRTDSITVQISGGWNGHLYIWADFDADGSFQQIDDLVYQSVTTLPTGTHTIPIRPPFHSVVGETYLRCRLTIDSFCDPWGFKNTGEVEDYKITIENDTTHIKWSQPPIRNTEPGYLDYFWGWDELSIYGGDAIVADDWLCDDYQPVSAICWWGSYHNHNGLEPPTGPGTPYAFHLGIWTDVPSGGSNPWSHPDNLIWDYIVPVDLLNIYHAGMEYHPVYPSLDDDAFEYIFEIPQEHWFYQLPETGVHWLSISAMYIQEPVLQWGWLSRYPVWNDAAVKISDPTSPIVGSPFISGQPVADLSETPWDMSFLLLTEQVEVETPVGITITVFQDSSLAKVEWSAVAGARLYLIFGSNDPYASYPSGWTLLGITPDLYWNDGPPLPEAGKKFYKVVAY